MKPSDFLTPDLISLNLRSSTKEEVLEELVWMLDVKEEYRPILLDMVLQREGLGSTGLGGGVAIPHGRSLIVNHLHLVCGLSTKGIYFQAIDRKKVHLFFLVIAPHREVSNQYLPLLGSIARLASEPENIERLRKAETPEQCLEFLEQICS
jgi:mannitol/fructose-specific phosphotransferase system IIA component (Ntr-type)